MHMIYIPVGIAISKYIGNMVPAIVSAIIYCLFPFNWHALPKYQKYSVGNFCVMFVSSISTQLHIRMQAYFCTHDIVPLVRKDNIITECLGITVEFLDNWVFDHGILLLYYLWYNIGK